MQLDEVPDDRQPETEAAVRARGAAPRPVGSARTRAAETPRSTPGPVSRTTIPMAARPRALTRDLDRSARAA